MYKKIFTESEAYPKSDLTTDELNFFRDHGFIDVRGGVFFSKFVGEIKTPENKFYSVPKNFPPENTELFDKVLEKYKEIDGKSLGQKTSFLINKSGEYKSEKFYYQQLKGYFLDFITYGFIYPNKTIKKHSTSPVRGGKIDVFSTLKNRRQKGPGITYDIKDIKNNKDWNIDDIYWSVIDELSQKHNDRREVLQMKKFLDSEGYKIKNIDISNSIKMIHDVNNCQVGIIHYPIKNTLLAYFESMKISGKKIDVKAFYTSEFQFVWERLIQKALHHNIEFKNKLDNNFKRIETRTKWFQTESEMEKFIYSNKIKDKKIELRETPGFYLTYELDVESRPDIFSIYNNKKFIGDAKYYRDQETSNFDKEFRTYNLLTFNKYPMCVFLPSTRTRVLYVRREEELELVVFRISIEQVIDDATNNTNNTIERVHQLLFAKRNTVRVGEDYDTEK
jgi:hypothetical protein